MRIAPVNSAMISSARSRDPRLMRMRTHPTAAPQQQHHVQQPSSHSSMALASSSVAKAMPRIPKLSHSNNNHKSSRDSERDRDPRSRRNKEKEELSKSSKVSPSSKDKSKSKLSSGDRKKSGSSDDSSPRKKSEEEKKSSKSSSSSSHHHRTSHLRHRSSKSPTKSATDVQDVDLRVKPDSTTNNSNKDKLLSDLLNGENMKSSHEMITSDENGKENKPILVVTINMQRFIVTAM
jgi:hypothetical protein